MIDETDRIMNFFNRGAEKGCRRLLDLFFNGHAFSRSLLDEICKITTENEYLEFWQKQIKDFEFLNKKVIKTTKEEAQKIKEFIDEELSSAVNEGFKGKQAIISAQIIRDIINEYYVVQDMDQDMERYFDFSEISTEKLKILLDNMNLFIVETSVINSIIPDKYLLSRIFKKFKVETNKRPTDEPEKPHNIVIYAGNAHSDRIRKFLDEELDFKMIHTAGRKWPRDNTEPEVYRNCIQMNDFPQPFFSNHPDVDWMMRKRSQSPTIKTTGITKKSPKRGKYKTKKPGTPDMQYGTGTPDIHNIVQVLLVLLIYNIVQVLLVLLICQQKVFGKI